MTYFTHPFTILADTKVGEAKKTRHSRASAMCLADDWAEAGHAKVRIVDPGGSVHGRSQFRETLLLVKQARRRALTLA